MPVAPARRVIFCGSDLFIVHFCSNFRTCRASSKLSSEPGGVNDIGFSSWASSLLPIQGVMVFFFPFMLVTHMFL